MIVQCSQQWELAEQLGAGGFGRVFAANGADGRLAAAKLVHKQPGADRELLFVDVGDARNVIPVIDVGETDDSWVLVMPKATQSLAHYIEAHGALGVDRALPVLIDIATALADLDGRVVHRDLKPQNVLLLDGVWCLADFGISRYAEASTAPDTQKFAMSPPYAAPERWRFERATSAADVYALGIIAHELLTANLPLPGPTWEAFREQHLHVEPPRTPGVPPRLASLIEETLYKAPGARPTPGNVLARLERAGSEPRLPGAARLAGAYQAEAAQKAERSHHEALAHTEEERRSALTDASQNSYRALSGELADLVNEEVAAASIKPTPTGSWSVELGGARLSLSSPTRFRGGMWDDWKPPTFDVIAYATIRITVPPNRPGYVGRSHSLYFCDAVTESSYAWFETAYMISPLVAASSREAPFALDPGASAAKALAPMMAEYQVAWPFTELVIDETDDFLDRWLSWFAAAAQKQLGHPGTMPEKNPNGSWRR